MSIEIASGAFPQEGLPVSDREIPIRGHHWDAYGHLVGLVAHPDITSLYEASQKETQRIIDDVNWVTKIDFEWGYNYRKMCGFDPRDESLPWSKAEDVIGDDELQFRARMENHFIDFLTLPDATPVVIGPIMDRICKNSAFGNGEGGLHCQFNDKRVVRGEIDKAQEFLQEVDTFFGIPPNWKLMRRYPEGIQITVEDGIKSKKNYVPGSDSSGLVTVHGSLGLFRDILTNRATRDTTAPFVSYHTMLQAKGMSTAKPFS